jgi:parallel beta-helix repeat protein
MCHKRDTHVFSATYLFGLRRPNPSELLRITVILMLTVIPLAIPLGGSYGLGSVEATPTAPITVTASASSLNYAPSRNTVSAGGYFYVFYVRRSDNYLVYRSSSDGASWGSETQASHAPVANAQDRTGEDWTVFTDASTVYVAYPIGTYSTSSLTSTTGYTRKGSASSGSIVWDSQVMIRQAGGYWQFSFAKTTSKINLAVRAYSTTSKGYHVHVYNSPDGASWTEILDSATMTDGYNACGVAITTWPQYPDGLILVTGKYSASTYNYKTYDGSNWGPDSTFASKTAKTYAAAWGYTAFSLATYDNEVHFANIPSANAGGAITYYYYTNSWASATTVDKSTCFSPSLTAHPGNLYLFYTIGGTIYYREMAYSTHSWDANPTSWLTGESKPTYVDGEQYPSAQEIGVAWRAGGKVRFDYLTPSVNNQIVSSTKMTSSTVMTTTSTTVTSPTASSYTTVVLAPATSTTSTSTTTPSTRRTRSSTSTTVTSPTVISSATVTVTKSTTLTSTQATSTSATTTSTMGQPNYIVSTDGTTISALNTATGKVDFSGTDAAAVIMQAAKPNSKVLISAGTYIINHVSSSNDALLISNSNVELYGATNTAQTSNAAILKLANGMNRRTLSITGTSNVYIHDLQIDGNRANQPQSGFTPANGIMAWSNTGLTVSNNYVHDVRNFGIDFNGCSNCIAANNLIVNSDANGMQFEGSGGGTTRFSGNIIDGASDVGITIWSGTGVIIENNIIRNIMMNTSPWGGNDHTGIYTENNSPNNIFRNNIISNVEFGFSDDSSTGVTVDGNTFYLQSLTGSPYPFWTGSSSGGTFSNNKVYVVSAGGSLRLSGGWTLQNNVILT